VKGLTIRYHQQTALAAFWNSISTTSSALRWVSANFNRTRTLSVKRIKSVSLDYSTQSLPAPRIPPRIMSNHARVNYFLGCIGIIILVLSILTVPMTLALPSSTEIRPIEIPTDYTEDNDAWVSPRSKLGRFFSEWVGGGNRAQMVAEVSKPHIKRWHNRRRYRGVHH
jgi:hypothetical protein